ncbi:MFS transporter [soil metagenome]
MRLWPTGGLWRHPDFIKLWSAETVSQFGTQFTVLALPLAAIIVLDASVFEIAVLNVLEFLPFVLFSLPAGVWVDRLRRKPILVTSDLIRAVLLVSIPIAYAFDALTIWHLFAVAFTVGIATVFFDVAYQSYLPSLVNRRQLVDGNSKLEISRSTAQLGGPGLAGLLIDLLSAPVALLADALSFLGSALFLFGIRKREGPPRGEEREPRRRMREEIAEGLRYVFRHSYLKNIAACTATFNFFGGFANAAFLIFAYRVLDLSAAAIGIALSLGNVGALLAAFSSGRITQRFGVGPTIIGASILGGPVFLLVPFAPHGNAALAVIAPSILIGSFTNVLYNVTQLSLRQTITPERLQGRMNSVMRFVVWGTIPIGTLVGGALGTWIGVRETLIIGAIGSCLPFLPVLFSPLRRLRDMPEPPDEEALLGDPLLTDAAAVAVRPPGA